VREVDDLGGEEDGRGEVDERLGRADVLCVGGGLERVAEWLVECVDDAPEGDAPELGAPEDAPDGDAPPLTPDPPAVTGTPGWPDPFDPFDPFEPDWRSVVVGAVVPPCGAVGECDDGFSSRTRAVAMIATKASAAAASAAPR
jgi:hypothetical protein